MKQFLEPQGSPESFAKNLAEFKNRIDELEEFAEQEYKPTVISYKEGRETPAEVKSTMKEMAQRLDDVWKKSIDLVEEKTELPSIEYSDEKNEVLQEIEEKGFEIPSSLPNRFSYATKAADAEIGYQVFTEIAGEPDTPDELTRSEELTQVYENTEDRMIELEREIHEYEREFLSETLDTTVAEIQTDNLNHNEKALMNKTTDNWKREKVMQNPSDSYLGYRASKKGTESFKKAREKVRESLETNDLGPTKKEIEENNQNIEESRKTISEKEKLRYIY